MIMTPTPASKRTHASSLTFTYLLFITTLLSPHVHGYWDNFSFGNGKWFMRVRENVGNVQRDGRTDVYDCHTTNTRNTRDPALDGAIVWNRPGEPAILALAFYADTMCGNSVYAPNKGRPLAVMVMDKKRLRGMHIANFKRLDDVIPPALISTKRTVTVQAVRVAEEVQVGGFLRGIPPRELVNSIVWWDVQEKRHVLRNGVSWANGVLYEGINEARDVYKLLREVVERATNADGNTQHGNSDYLMMIVNEAAGMGQRNMELLLPGYDANVDYTLETDDDYGRPIHEFGGETLGPVLTSGRLGGVALRNEEPAVGRRVEIQGMNLFQPAPEPGPGPQDTINRASEPGQVQSQPVPTVDSLSVQNNPSAASSKDSLFDNDDIPEDLRRALQQVEREVEAHDPVGLIARLDIPIDQLTAAFNAAPNKKTWLDNMENKEKVNMRILLVVKDWYAEYEERRQGLPPGTLTRPNAWAGLDIDTANLFPDLRRVFDQTVDKKMWYALMESRQKWNMRALRAAREIYEDWLETERDSVRAYHGSGTEEQNWDAFSEGTLPAGNNNAQEWDEVTPPPEEDDVVLQQGQQNAAIDEEVVQIEPVEGLQSVSADVPVDFTNTDSFFATALSPTFVIPDEINWDAPIPESSNREVARSSSIAIEPEVDQAPAVDTEIQQPQSQPEPQEIPRPQENPNRGTLRLQTQGIDPTNPLLINDLFKYFDPESDAFNDILSFNPRLIQEIRKDPAGVLKIPYFGMRHYVPPVPDFDFEDEALLDTPSEEFSGTLIGSDEDLGFEEGDVEERAGQVIPAAEQILEEVIEQVPEQVLDAASIIEPAGGILRQSTIEEEIPEPANILQPESAITDLQIQSTEPLLGGLPASEVLEQLQEPSSPSEEEEEEEEQPQPRRSTRYNGQQPPPRQPPKYEPSFTPKPIPRRRRKVTNMADVIEDVPAVQVTTNNDKEPALRRIEYWNRPLENRRDRNTLIKSRGSNRDATQRI
ncbi:hypothetical protein TWF481_003318 [Arthrobotrys musiformis]|uniref:Uncharacterized protein n=1 Tax=Arthrobotrys musiformis TaxID=47236 RepID=A0AAV9VSW3_9PEZI